MIVAPTRKLLLLLLIHGVCAFQIPSVSRFWSIHGVSERSKRRFSYSRTRVWGSSGSGESSGSDAKKTGDNKAMQFLKKIGKVGGSANRDFRYAIGVDEGPAGKSSGGQSSLKKAKAAYKSCVDTGVIDDMSEVFPTTCSGTRWSGFT